MNATQFKELAESLGLKTTEVDELMVALDELTDNIWKESWGNGYEQGFNDAREALYQIKRDKVK